MVLGSINKTAWAPNGSIGLPIGLYQFMSHTEGITLLLGSEWVFKQVIVYLNAPGF